MLRVALLLAMSKVPLVMLYICRFPLGLAASETVPSALRSGHCDAVYRWFLSKRTASGRRAESTAEHVDLRRRCIVSSLLHAMDM